MERVLKMLSTCDMRKKVTGSVGYSLIEVIIAMTIFSIIAGILLAALSNADKLKARGSTISSVAEIAKNEAEIIKNVSQLGGKLIDTSYDVHSGKKDYTVERKVLNSTSSGLLQDTSENEDIDEIEISVFEKNKSEKVWRFNLLQGNTQ